MRAIKYKQTVTNRIVCDHKFFKALYIQALAALFEGETGEGLYILRSLAHAVTFKKLANKTSIGEKSLHRMLSRRGNPTTRNLFSVMNVIRKELVVK